MGSITRTNRPVAVTELRGIDSTTGPGVITGLGSITSTNRPVTVTKLMGIDGTTRSAIVTGLGSITRTNRPVTVTELRGIDSATGPTVITGIRPIKPTAIQSSTRPTQTGTRATVGDTSWDACREVYRPVDRMGRVAAVRWSIVILEEWKEHFVASGPYTVSGSAGELVPVLTL